MADELETPRQLQTLRAWSSLQQRGARLTSYWRDILDRDPTGADIVMVVEVIIGGSRFRFATDIISSVSGNDGSDHSVQAAMIAEVPIQHSYTLGDATSATRGVSLAVPVDAIKPLQFLASGLPLTGWGEVALEPKLRRGSADHDRRYVIIQGELSGGVAFGALRSGEAEVVDFEIVDPKSSMDARVPRWIVDSTRFSTQLHDTAIGARIPVVFNGYNAIPGIRVDDVSGARRFMFADRHGWDTDNAITYVNGTAVAPGNLVYGHEFVELFDDQGVAYTAVSFTEGATVWADNDEVYVTIDHLTDSLSVVDVIKRVCLDHTPLGEAGISQSLFTAAAAKTGFGAPRVVINGASSASSARAFEWLEGAFLEEFPMLSMVWDNGGYGPIVTDRRASPVMKLVMGQAPLIDRGSLSQETDKDDLFNDWVLRYDYDPILDVFHSVKTRNAGNSALCEISQQHLGLRSADIIEAVYIASDDLADQTLDWLVEHRALPSYLVEYEGHGKLYWLLRRGDVIELDDEDFDWVDITATVEEITYTRGRVTLGLRVWVQFTKLGGSSVTFRPPDPV